MVVSISLVVRERTKMRELALTRNKIETERIKNYSTVAEIYERAMNKYSGGRKLSRKDHERISGAVELTDYWLVVLVDFNADDNRHYEDRYYSDESCWVLVPVSRCFIADFLVDSF